LNQWASEPIQAELGHNHGHQLTPDDFSVLLCSWLESEFEPPQDSLETLTQWLLDQSIRQQLRQQLTHAIDRAKYGLLPPAEKHLIDLLDDPEYLCRIACLLFDRQSVGAVSSCLRIAARSCTREETSRILPMGINLGLIFGTHPALFQDTVQAWHVDSQRTCLSRGPACAGVNVLGVHQSWLTSEMAASRALVVDETGLVKEISFDIPQEIHAVHITELPSREELALHRNLSLRFKRSALKVLNPYETAVRADDKIVTHRLLDTYKDSVPTPSAMCVCRQSSPQDALNQLKSFVHSLSSNKPGQGGVELFVQPNQGTEGYQVEGFVLDPSKMEDIPLCDPILRHLLSINLEQDVLIREGHGNVRFMDSEDAGYCRIVFRIHVAWDGRQFVAESGFAQVAPERDALVASRGRGGRVIAADDALTHLFYWNFARRAWISIELDEDDFNRLRATAVRAAEAINSDVSEEQRLCLMGLDVLFDVNEESHGHSVIPLVLEVNPRLAGLNQSSSLDSKKTGNRSYITESLFMALPKPSTIRHL